MLSPQESRRLDLLRFPLILGVVFIHAHVPLSMRGSGGPFAPSVWIPNLISEVLARVAVPLFFAMSGYLFFLGFDGTAASFARKLKSRAWSLLVPYLIWNLGFRLATLAGWSLMGGVGTDRAAELKEGGVLWFLATSLGYGRFPAVYPLWFIRDLMLLVAASPLVYALVRSLGPITPLLLAGCWLGGFWPIYAPEAEATFFFTLGAYGGLRQINPFALDRFGPAIASAYALLALADASMMGTVASRYLHRVGILVGVPAVLYLTKAALASEPVKRALLFLATSSFFIFAAHEPLLGKMIDVASRALGGDRGIRDLMVYLLSPIVVCTLLVVAHRILSRFAPGFTRLITGGR